MLSIMVLLFVLNNWHLNRSLPFPLNLSTIEAMDDQRGQVGIIVLLITVVMLTIGISVVSHTSTDVSISQTQQSASQALDAAQSAVEAAFANPQVVNPSASPVSTQSIVIDPGKLTAQYDATKLNYLETTLEEGQVAGIDLSNSTFVAGNQLRIAWGKETTCTLTAPASLVVSVYNMPASGSAVVNHYYLSPCSRDASVTDGFTVLSPPGAYSGYYASYLLSLQTGDKLVRFRPIYSQTGLLVNASGTWSLGNQSLQVHASAKDLIGLENKSIQVDQSLPTAPNIFEYTLYSGTTISE